MPKTWPAWWRPGRDPASPAPFLFSTGTEHCLWNRQLSLPFHTLIFQRAAKALNSWTDVAEAASGCFCWRSHGKAAPLFSLLFGAPSKGATFAESGHQISRLPPPALDSGSCLGTSQPQCLHTAFLLFCILRTVETPKITLHFSGSQAVVLPLGTSSEGGRWAETLPEAGTGMRFLCSFCMASWFARRDHLGANT